MNEQIPHEDGILITVIRRMRGNMYGIYSGSELVAEIDAQTLAEEDIVAAGNYISEAELERIRFDSECRRARAKALGIIARREVSSSQLAQKLEQAGFGVDASAAAVEKMVESGLVDDERCARMMAEDIYHLKHYGRRRCAYELAAKGIGRDLAESVAAELEPDPQETIYGLLTGKLARDMDTEAGIRRCTNTLMRYGFEPSDIRAVFSRLRDELEQDE